VVYYVYLISTRPPSMKMPARKPVTSGSLRGGEGLTGATSNFGTDSACARSSGEPRRVVRPSSPYRWRYPLIVVPFSAVPKGGSGKPRQNPFPAAFSPNQRRMESASPGAVRSEPRLLRMPKREVLKLEYGAGLKGRRSGGGQHVKRVEGQEEKSTKGSQTPCSHSVRYLR
jgi:hypothetical protein